MPKNIVILSDGTGNSSSALFKTNVWRLYQALELSEPEQQVAYYHDGVGTSSNKYIAAITGLFGYGLKRGVLDMYMFLCRSYRPGDRIFGFGFSRGSFAVRILMGLVAKEGLAPYEGNDAQLEMDARAAYRRFRKGFKLRGPLHIEVPFRWLRDRFYAWRDPRSRTVRFHNLEGYKREGSDPDCIHFVGLWDTVDAYGGPIDEITIAIDYWIWPLTMPNQIPSEKIRRICHALSLDDERRAFWPRLFREDVVQGRDGTQAAPTATTVEEMRAWRAPDPLPANFSLAPIDQQRLTQVWFAGMHSDVGGSYPQDGLAYVALAWMMDRANVYGLLVRPQEESELRRCANRFDKLNDSRSGFGAYYRYQPRNLGILRTAGSYTPLCVKTWNWLQGLFGFSVKTEPIIVPGSDAMIHDSVFRRIEQGINPYAPITVPDSYRVTDAAGNVRPGPYWAAPAVVQQMSAAKPAAASQKMDATKTQKEDAAKDVPAVEKVLNLVWARRVAYFTTVFVSLIVALYPIYNHKCWDCPLTYWTSAFGKKWLAPPIGWAQSVLPSLVGEWTSMAQESPEVVWPGIITIVLLLFLGGYLETQLRTGMEQIWRIRANRPPQTPWGASWPASMVANSPAIYAMRCASWYRELFAALRYCILPTLLVWGPIVGLTLYYLRNATSFWGCAAWWLIVGACALWVVVNIGCFLFVEPDDVPAAHA